MNDKKIPCPVCETKKQLSSIDLSPEELEEMAEEENFADAVENDIYQRRMEICRNCKYLQNGMTCGQCGCFVQFRAKHSTAHCAMGKW